MAASPSRRWKTSPCIRLSTGASWTPPAHPLLTPSVQHATLTECGTGETAGSARPTERMLSWAVDSIGGDALIASVQALHGDQGPWWLRVDANGRTEHMVLRSLTPRIDAELIATGA